MRRRLALLAAATTLLVLVAFLVPLALLVRTVAADRAVNAATAQVQSLTTLVAAGELDDLRQTVAQVNADAADPVTVFLADGTTIGAAAPRTPAVELALRGRSLSVDTAAGRQILVSVQGMASGPAAISTVVPDAELHRGVLRAWLILGGLGLLLVVLGVAVADRLARSLVEPITGLATVSHRLAAGDLDARAAPAGPREVADVAAALNQLAGRIRQLLQAERESAADLSHRLRTPLTALRLDAEALRDPAEAGRLAADIDALERAVSAAISEARHPRSASGRCDAAAVVRDRVAFWSVLAEETGRTIDVRLPDHPVPVPLPADDLAGVLDALLGNVFAHTPDGTGAAVRLTERPTRLVVDDDGPGFPRRDVLARGASTAGSTGLGLDIAARTARRAGGRIEAGASPTGGARVTIEFPADSGSAPGP